MTETINMRDTTTVTLTRAGRRVPLWQPFRLCSGLPKIPFITGRWVLTRRSHNTITNVGHAAANGLMSNQGAYGFALYMAIGIGTQGTPATSTTLASEITTNGGARAAGTASQVTVTVTNDATQLVHTWTFTGSFAVTEEGILTASSAGTLVAYQSWAAINVVSGDTLQVTHKYQT